MAALNEQQKYLLNRLPNNYAFKGKSIAETPEVKQARKVIAAFDEKNQKFFSDRKSKYLKALKGAREAIYFKTPEKALDTIKALEAEFTEDIKE